MILHPRPIALNFNKHLLIMPVCVSASKLPVLAPSSTRTTHRTMIMVLQLLQLQDSVWGPPSFRRPHTQPTPVLRPRTSSRSRQLAHG